MKSVLLVLWTIILLGAVPATGAEYQTKLGDTWESVFSELAFFDKRIRISDLKEMNGAVEGEKLQPGRKLEYVSQSEYWRAWANVDQRMGVIPKGSSEWLSLCRDRAMMKHFSVDYSSDGSRKEKGIYWRKILDYAHPQSVSFSRD